MYEAITRDIRVRVQPLYMADRSEPSSNQYFWAYTIEITNLGSATVQLRSRHWKITNGVGQTEHVRGPGVVGEQPVLGPGESFEYTSGCPLDTPSGIMVGTYQMVDDTGTTFEVAIPAFSLDTPSSRRSLN